MLNIQKKYVTNEDHQPVAVQVDIETFNKMEALLEDHALAQLIEKSDESETFSLEEARKYYNQIKKRITERSGG
jgi:hypothetical protein